MSLGAAAIIAAGAVPVMAAALEAPETTAEASKVKAGTIVDVATTVKPDPDSDPPFEGMTITITEDSPATVTINCPVGAVVITNGCNLDGVSTKEVVTVGQQVRLPESEISRDTTVVLTSLLKRGEEKLTDTTSITFTTTKDDPKPTPPPSSSKPPPDKPSPTESSGKDDDNDGGSSGSGSGSSGGGAGSSYTPPAPNGSFGAPNVSNPQLSLPSAAGAPNPSVAPQASPTPENRLRNNKAPVAQDLTFERMASTQIAWLAALLVAFSVLLTQLRLGRRRTASARALSATGRPAGNHRRPRRGLFGK